MISLNEIIEGFFKAFQLILSLDPEVLNITLLSLRVSGTAVILGSIVGLPSGALLGLYDFKGKQLVVNFVNTMMGLPPVVVGLFVFLLLSRSGPLGLLDLLYTPLAMIIAQFILATPIITGITMAAVSSIDRTVRETAISLGATEGQLIWTVLKETRMSMLSGIIVAFGRVISEVGAIMIVGGNIRWYTRALTTAIVLETRRGEFALAIALGLILILLAFIINMMLTYLQRKGERIY